MIFLCKEKRWKSLTCGKGGVYLNILNKGSDVQERYLNRSSHLLIGCIHEHFQGINPILVVLPQLIYLVCSCILPMTQRKTVNDSFSIRKSQLMRQMISYYGFFLTVIQKGIVFTCLTLTNSSLHLPFRRRSCCFKSRETVSSQVSMRKLPASFMSMCCCIQWGRFLKKSWKEGKEKPQPFSTESQMLCDQFKKPS